MGYQEVSGVVHSAGSLEPMRMVIKLNRKSLRALKKSGHHNVPRRNQGVVHSARVCHMSKERERQTETDTDQTQSVTVTDSDRQ